MRTKTLATFILFLFLSIFSFGQGIMEKYPKIEERKERINKNDSLKTITLENEEFLEQMTDGGGELIGYYDQNKKIKKIKLTIYESTGIRNFTFYLENENPILIEEKFKQFHYDEKSNSFDQTKFDGGFNGTYLFENNKLLDWITLGHNRFEDEEIEIEKTFNNELNSYLKLIKKRIANNVYRK